MRDLLRSFGKKISLTSCGHTFCETCAAITVASKPQCPKCRRSVGEDNMIPCFALNDIIGNMMIRCTNSSNENEDRKCEWKGKLSSLKEHVTKDCKWEVISCLTPECPFRCARKDMEAHEKANAQQHFELKVEAKVKTTVESRVVDLKREFESTMEEEIESRLV